MTRSITIVNTSNWDGEDYLIDPQDGYNKPMALKPGELCQVYPKENGEQQPVVTPVTPRGKPAPFALKGIDSRQVVPRIEVAFR